MEKAPSGCEVYKLVDDENNYHQCEVVKDGRSSIFKIKAEECRISLMCKENVKVIQKKQGERLNKNFTKDVFDSLDMKR